MKRIVAVCLVCLVAMPAAPRLALARDDMTHLLEARVGVGALSLREDLLIPYAFTGPALALAAQYRLGISHYRFETGLRVNASVMWTREQEFGAAAFHEAFVRAASTVLLRERRTTALGPSLRYANDGAYLFEWDDAHGYWLSSLLLGVYGAHHEQLTPKFDLELMAEFGILGFASRPPARRLNKQDPLNQGSFYFRRFGYDPDFTWLGRTQQLRWDVLIRLRSAGSRLGAGWAVGYEGRLSRSERPETFCAWYNGVQGNYAWSWP